MNVRRGFSLVELLVVMSVLIALTPIAFGFVTRAMQHHRRSTHRDDMQRVVENLTRQFRVDVDAMQSIEIRQDEDIAVDAPVEAWTLSDAQGRHVEYQVYRDRVERLDAVDDEVTQRETYAMVEHCRVSCLWDESRHLAELSVWRDLGASGPRHLLSRVVAQLARDGRFAVPENQKQELLQVDVDDAEVLP